MDYAELNRDMHASSVRTMRELFDAGLATQEELDEVLALQAQFEQELQEEARFPVDATAPLMVIDKALRERMSGAGYEMARWCSTPQHWPDLTDVITAGLLGRRAGYAFPVPKLASKQPRAKSRKQNFAMRLNPGGFFEVVPMTDPDPVTGVSYAPLDASLWHGQVVVGGVKPDGRYEIDNAVHAHDATHTPSRKHRMA